ALFAVGQAALLRFGWRRPGSRRRPRRRLMIRNLFAILALATSTVAMALDHSHKAWDDLLKKHVKYVQNGNASRVDYAGFMKDRAQLKAVLDDYRKVTKAEFDTWTKPQQQAFLINAYNAFTVEKILTRYPDINSIRD